MHVEMILLRERNHHTENFFAVVTYSVFKYSIVKVGLKKTLL